VPATWFDPKPWLGSVRRAKFTVLFSHANAEDLGLVYEHLKTLSEVLQVNVLGYEYTGYGQSTGTPSEADCYADIAAAFSWLMTEKNLLPVEVILFGRSIGSGPTVELASRAEVGGIILQSAFTSCIRVAYDVKHTAFDAFCNIKKLPKVRCPVLIIHGTRDDVVSLQHGKELFKLCRRPHRPFWVRVFVFVCNCGPFLQGMRGGNRFAASNSAGRAAARGFIPGVAACPHGSDQTREIFFHDQPRDSEISHFFYFFGWRNPRKLDTTITSQSVFFAELQRHST